MQVITEFRTRCRLSRGHLQARGVWVKFVAGLGPEGDEHDRVVTQALTDAWKFVDLSYARSGKLLGRTDAR